MFEKKIYHSAAYTTSRMSTRRCNYIVKYKGSSLVNYAYIKYFINIDSAIYVAVLELNIVSNITQNIKGRTYVIISNLISFTIALGSRRHRYIRSYMEV